jgi:hypothetical protein
MLIGDFRELCVINRIILVSLPRERKILGQYRNLIDSERQSHIA